MVRTSPSFWLMAVILVFVSSSADAAVRRRVTIRSTPPGALVYIDDQEIGVTPVSTSFTYYGTRKVQLVKDGYETVTVLRTFKPPWYQLPIIDFVTENLFRSEYRDERLLEFKLIPLRLKTNQELLQRGDQLRQRARQGVVTSAPAQPRSLRSSSPVAPTAQSATALRRRREPYPDNR